MARLNPNASYLPSLPVWYLLLQSVPLGCQTHLEYGLDFLSFEILRDQYPLVLAPVTALFLEINTSGLMHLRHFLKKT